jgi:protein TonB
MTMRAAWAHPYGTIPAGAHAAHFALSSSRALRRGLAISLTLHGAALLFLGFVLARTMPPSSGKSGERLVRVRLLQPATVPAPAVPAQAQPRVAPVASAQLPPPRHADIAPTRPKPPPATARREPSTALVTPPRTSKHAAPPEALSVAVMAEPTGFVVSLPAPAETGAGYDSAPIPSHVIKPVYPLRARQRGEEGSLEAELLVESDGSVGAATIRRSSGFADLDRAALAALRAARFAPARRLGGPVAARMRITVVFRLTDA